MTALVGSIQNTGLLAGTSTGTITLTGTTAGNTIVVWGWHQAGTTAYTSITVTDGGNSWTNSSNQLTNNVRSTMAAAAFSIGTGGTRTITVTFNGGTGGAFGEYFAGEFSGGLSAFDKVGSNTAFSASPVTATAGGVDSGTDNLAISGASAGSSSASMGWSSPNTGGAAWTAAGVNQDDSANAAGQCSYRINSSAVTDAPTWTFTGTPLTNGSSAGVWSIKTAPTLPVITLQPASATIPETATASFTVAATFFGTSPTYQWQDNRTGSFTNVSGGSGATTATYTTAASTQFFSGRQYRCVVADSAGSTNSNSATLLVSNLSVILWNTSVQIGNDVWLRDPTSTAAGGPTNYADNLSVGTYSISGKTVSDSVVRGDALSTGAYVIAGKTVTDLLAKNDSLSKGTYVIAGQSITDISVHIDTLSTGAYVISGKTVTDLLAKNDSLANGAYVISGKTVTDLLAKNDSLSKGNYVYTGNDLNDTVTSSGHTNYADNLNPGAYVYVGNDLNDQLTIRVYYSDNLSAGAYVYAGNDLIDNLPLAQQTGAGDYDDKPKKPKKRFFIEHEGKLHVFSTQKAAIKALNSIPEKVEIVEVLSDQPVSKVQKPIELPAVQEYAKITGQIEQYKTAYNSQHFEAIIAMFEQMQDDEDVEMLLLSL